MVAHTVKPRTPPGSLWPPRDCRWGAAFWSPCALSHTSQAVVNDNILSFVLNMGCFFGAAGAGLTAGVAGYFVIAHYWVLCAVLGGVLGWLAAAMVAMVIDSGIATGAFCPVIPADC
jgi:Na+/H+-dicarboxylate symporter